MARDYDHLFKLLIIGDSGKLESGWGQKANLSENKIQISKNHFLSITTLVPSLCLPRYQSNLCKF